MPAGGDEPPLLVDTSVAVALVVGDHVHHEGTLEAIGHRRLGLSGHAAFETLSVLTRLPGPSRRTAETVGRVIAANFPETRHLSAAAAEGLFGQLPRWGVAGGAVYDALVAAAAFEQGFTLVTRDRRALETYRVLGVDVEVLDG